MQIEGAGRRLLDVESVAEQQIAARDRAHGMPVPSREHVESLLGPVRWHEDVDVTDRPQPDALVHGERQRGALEHDHGHAGLRERRHRGLHGVE